MKIKKKYQQLTYDDRFLIQEFLQIGLKPAKIAEHLGKNKSTITREIKRNSFEGKYHCVPAEVNTRNKRSQSRQIERLKSEEIRQYVHTALKKGWSPEIIAGRLELIHKKKIISHEAIYQYIYDVRKDLIQYLVRKHKKRVNKYYSKKKRADIIKNRVFIDNRPDKINNRNRFGDWETDTLISRQCKSVIRVLVERQARYVVINKLKDKTADKMNRSIVYYFSGLPKKLCLSITYDNGTENAYHQKTNYTLNCKSYFCNPYHSWEKGTIENTNGLIRRYIPKSTNFEKISKSQLKSIEKLLNNRPRKCLNFKTPEEVFNKKLVALRG